ncbi:immunity 49 family protein [Cellulophaga fucicola]|uniref:Immunity protein 49 n=1 Tax=Cellulophaga fucicola TaxID=76595 RepID=A0A1K1MUC4_9FLAO|nr:immunity 49 family protein [Cellulophaga fucicola]SFW26681.1 Immunity protein 49 [Cellulophaga fucicola]
MITINDRISDKLKSTDIWIQHISDDERNLKTMGLNFRFLEVDLAVKSINDKDYMQSKLHFYLASLLDKMRVEKFNDTLFDFGLPYIVYPILSDNEILIETYSKLRYNAWGRMPSMNENVLKGKDAVWCNTVQFFMVNDVQGIERNLNIIETLTLSKLPNNKQELKIDYDFYKALFNQDKGKCEELLEHLVSPKIHKKRNINDVLAQYVSQPALGYAKLAWRLGIEVEVNSPLIPKEILPIEPLDSYEIPYNFLRQESI